MKRKAKVIAVINQKGGVAKTTTTDAIISGLSSMGKKVLGVDMDALGGLTFSFGLKRSPLGIAGVLMDGSPIKEQIIKTSRGDIVPSSKALVIADKELREGKKTSLLQNALEPVRGDYDYIVIDTPPYLGILTINALTASDSAVIPAPAEMFVLEGLHQLLETISQVQKRSNPDLKIEGILLTMHFPRTVVSREVTKLMVKIAEKANTKIFRSTIRNSVIVREAQIKRKSLFDYAPKAKVTNDYRELINELIGG